MASFAWPNATLICGECHHAMRQDYSINKDNGGSVALAVCENPKCPNFERLFRIPKSQAIQLEPV